MKRIPNKEVMYQLLLSGQLGNTPFATDDVEEALRHNLKYGPKVFGIRGMQLGRSYLKAPIKAGQLRVAVAEAIIACGEGNFKIYETSDDYRVTMQGEFTTDPYCGYHLCWTKGQRYLKFLHDMEHFHSYGLEALSILRKYSDSASWIEELTNMYGSNTESTVVEFSCFSKPWGHLNKNTIIWEVRNY